MVSVCTSPPLFSGRVKQAQKDESALCHGTLWACVTWTAVGTQCSQRMAYIRQRERGHHVFCCDRLVSHASQIIIPATPCVLIRTQREGPPFCMGPLQINSASLTSLQWCPHQRKESWSELRPRQVLHNVWLACFISRQKIRLVFFGGLLVLGLTDMLRQGSF